MIIHDAQGDTPENRAKVDNYGQSCNHHALLTYERTASGVTGDELGTISLAPNELTTRRLPYWLLDIEPDAAVAYAILAREADVMQAWTIPTQPAIVVCPSPAPTWEGDHLGLDLTLGLRDLLLQGLAWSLQPDPLDGLLPPYALYWSHVIPTAEILAALQAQSREEGAGLP